MTEEKRRLYNKAYVELYEMIKLLSDEERNKIPDQFVNYICDNMDTNYHFYIDDTKGLLEQEYMVETKALIVKLYEKYFASESEAEFWNKYHKICFNIIEEEKKKKYSLNNVFKNQKIENIEKSNDKIVRNDESLIKYKESIFSKILNKIKNIFYSSKIE